MSNVDENIFLCWSGERSKALAQALHDWLPRVIQAAKPFISTETEKGARWFEEIGRKLENISIGIICLTPENLDERWLHFEAGALSKQVDQARVCPYLLDLKPGDVRMPLGAFQGAVADRSATRQMLDTINQAISANALSTAVLDDAFDLLWPSLETRIREIESMDSESRPVQTSARPDSDKLDEVLSLLRNRFRPPGEFEVTVRYVNEPELRILRAMAAQSSSETLAALTDSGEEGGSLFASFKVIGTLAAVRELMKNFRRAPSVMDVRITAGR